MKALKIISGLFILIILTVSAAKAQQQFTHTVTAANKYCNSTCSLTNISDPFAIIIVSPVLVNGTNRNPHPIGVFYVDSSKKWSILNVDGAALTEGVKFNVQYYLNPDANQFVFVVNQQGGAPCIDRAGLNSNPNAQVLFSPTGSPRGAWFNKHEAKIEYDASALKWCIFNLNGQPVNQYNAFNIVITSGGGGGGGGGGAGTNTNPNANTNTSTNTPPNNSNPTTPTPVPPLPTPTPSVNPGYVPGGAVGGITNPDVLKSNQKTPMPTPVPTPVPLPNAETKTPKSVMPTPTPGGGPAPSPTPALLKGFVDMHTHPMSHLAFGKKLLHGAPDIGMIIPAGTRNCNKSDFRATTINEALGNCSSTHGGWGLNNNPCGDHLRSFVINRMFDKDFAGRLPDGANLIGDHQHEGMDTIPFNFAYFPSQTSKVHQQMWWEWIKRAKELGNLRVMVALTVNSELLANILNGDNPKDDKTSADLQIDELITFVGRHSKGPNAWMEIAKTPADLRRIVGENKLAVILGMEVDNIGNFNKPGAVVNQETVKAEIQRLFDKGVRYVFPIHLVNNKFGGTAVYEDLFNFSNKYSTGSFFTVNQSGVVNFSLGDGSEAGVFLSTNKQIKPLLEGLKMQPYPPAFNADPTSPDFCVNPLLPFQAPLGCFRTFKILMGIINPPSEYQMYSTIPKGHVNDVGLTGIGKFAVLEMMKLGMLIDIDHMSDLSQEDTLNIAERLGNDYPVNIGHNGIQNFRSSERIASLKNVKRIAALGGVFGIGTADSKEHHYDAQTFISSFSEVWQAMGGQTYGAVAIGTDVNGMERLPRAPENGVLPNFYSNEFPACKTGNRTWDYPSEGVMHYGLMADFMRDVKQKNPQVYENLMNSAEHFARMWEKAERQKTKVQ